MKTDLRNGEEVARRGRGGEHGVLNLWSAASSFRLFLTDLISSPLGASTWVVALYASVLVLDGLRRWMV
ncbi:MAG TPA: hypothetical protein VLU91_05670 [Nitrososphaerales archaeon]|nr:hypothetical protein [Nitrososphaerales archaeon]